MDDKSDSGYATFAAIAADEDSLTELSILLGGSMIHCAISHPISVKKYPSDHFHFVFSCVIKIAFQSSLLQYINFLAWDCHQQTA